MRTPVALGLTVCLVAQCDMAPGPQPLDLRPPVLEDLTMAPQRLIFALLPADQVVGDSIRVPISLGVTAKSQGSPISEVWYVVQSPSSLEAPIATGQLTASGSGRYEDSVVLTLSALDVKTYTVLVYAVDEAQRISGDMRASLPYYRSFEPGMPPVIDSLAIPDTLVRPAAGEPAVSLELIAAVSDPDGQSDIGQVDFWNAAAPGTRFLMCDDGGAAPCGSSADSGDRVAGDGQYTRRVFITSNNSAGTTTLVFEATDRAGLTSQVVSHDVVIL